MAENRGKQFETIVKHCFEKVDNISIDRFHDQTTGYLGSSNVSDFVVYLFPNEFYVECKSIHGNTLNLSNITDTQFKGLLEKSVISGVYAGLLIWFVDRDETWWVDITYVNNWKRKGSKSINVKLLKEIPGHIVRIPAVKKRVFFEYDMRKFLFDLTHLRSVE